MIDAVYTVAYLGSRHSTSKVNFSSLQKKERRREKSGEEGERGEGRHKLRDRSGKKI